MRDRNLLIGGLVALVLGIAGMAVASQPALDDFDMPHGWMMGRWQDQHDEDVPPVISDAETFGVAADEFAFRPGRLVIPSGRFNLELVNEGGVFHDLTIEEIGVHLNANPGESVTGGFDSIAPGEYTFSCTVPGHAAAGMVGTLVVEG